MITGLMLAAGEAAAATARTMMDQGTLPNGQEPSGVSNFLEIVTKPDNIPIVALLFIVIYFFALSMRMARENDRLSATGEREKIYDRMNRWVYGETDEEA